jgi:hypothetical protein
MSVMFGKSCKKKKKKMERIKFFFSWAMHREAEHASSTHAQKKVLDFDQ